MSAKHTPGPWHLEKDHDGVFTAIGEPIAIVGGEETGEQVRFTIGRTCDYGPHGDEQTTANAQLIAAAPDLLAACEAALMQFEENASYDEADGYVVRQLQSAIAKARGQQ